MSEREKDEEPMTIPPPSDPVQAIRERLADVVRRAELLVPTSAPTFSADVQTLREALSALGSSVSPSSPSASEGREAIIAKLHILLAEALRCLADERYDAVRRKVGYADVLVCELEALSTAGSPVPQPSEVLSLSIQNDPLAIGALLDDSTRTKEFYAGVVYEIQKLIGHSAFEAPTTELPKLVAERLAGSPVPSSELERLLGMGTPWPVHDVLAKLADAADHLLIDHNCDKQGWEVVRGARNAAREAVTRILAWGKAVPSSPAGTVEDP